MRYNLLLKEDNDIKNIHKLYVTDTKQPGMIIEVWTGIDGHVERAIVHEINGAIQRIQTITSNKPQLVEPDVIEFTCQSFESAKINKMADEIMKHFDLSE